MRWVTSVQRFLHFNRLTQTLLKPHAKREKYYSQVSEYVSICACVCVQVCLYAHGICNANFSKSLKIYAAFMAPSPTWPAPATAPREQSSDHVPRVTGAERREEGNYILNSKIIFGICACLILAHFILGCIKCKFMPICFEQL